MNLMLSVMFLCLAVGVLSPRFGRLQQTAIAVIATVMTALYYFRAERFM
jgi:lipopolysaccharide export LptBFGC system permease protein LptF